MGIFGSKGQTSERLDQIQVNESSYGKPLAVVMGQQRVHQTLLWSNGLVSWKSDQGGKGGGKGGAQYIYATDLIAALCNGPVTSVADVWDGSSWLSNQWGSNTFTVGVNGVYSPANAAVLIADNGVAFATTYSATYNDFGAPAATVLSGTDYSPLQKVPYGTVLATGQYSVNPISIGTFALTAAAAASGGDTVYTGSLTGGASPYTNGASNAYIGFRFVVAGFADAANNGTFVCVASTASSVTLANANGVTETHAATAAETGNSYHFCSSDAGKTAQISYQYNMVYLMAQEVALIPSSGKVTVGSPDTNFRDLGVWYYNVDGGSGPNTLVRMTNVSPANPSAAGEYRVTLPGTGSSGGADWHFYVGSGGDLNQEVLIQWQYQNEQPFQGNNPNLLKFELFGGGLTQPIWPFILTGGTVQIGNQDGGQAPNEPSFPDEALGYSGTAYLAYGPMSMGFSGAPRCVNAEVTTPWSYGGYYSAGPDAGRPIVDCNPITCIRQVLTNAQWGLGNSAVPFPVSVIDEGPGGTWGTGSPTLINPTASQTSNPTVASQTGSDWHNPSKILNPNGATGNGSTGATVSYIETTSGQKLYASDFTGLSSIPSGATITGIEVHWTSRGFDSHGTNVSTVLNISLETSPGVVVAFRTVPVGINTDNVLGGPTDAWGLSLTPAQLSASTFSVGFQSGPGAAWGSAAWNCYLKVYYTTTSPGTRNTDSTAASWFASNSFFISPFIDSQESASSIIGKWLEAGACGAYYSEGLLKIVPYGTQSTAGNGSTWVAPTSAVVALDDTCFVGKEGEDPVKVSRSSPYDGHNKVQISWTNRVFQYQTELTQEADQSAVNRWGERLEDVQSCNFICTLGAATFTASMRIKRIVNNRRTFEFVLPFIYAYLEPMDLLEISTTSQWAAGLNNTNLGIVNLAIRITKIVDDPNGKLEITCEDSLFASGLPTLHNKQIAAGNAIANAYLPPGDSKVVMFEPSNRLIQYRGDAIWIGACGTTDQWGSTNIWVSQDGTKYQHVGTITAPARLGVLDSTFASGSDPDAAHSLVVDLFPNCPALEAGTTTDADSGNTLCFVDGEIVAYSACAVTGQNQQTMSGYIRRGQRGTVIASHSAGAPFLRIDSAVFEYVYDPFWRTKPLYFKFQSVNSFGNCAQDLSTLAPVTFTVPGLSMGTVDGGSGLIIDPVTSHAWRHGLTLDSNDQVASQLRMKPLTAQGVYTGANPLTQSGTTTTILIAASTIQWGSNQVSYNSGSVTPGGYGTFYVYADDPTFAGGAVTYVATTSALTLNANDGRVQFGVITTAGGGGGGGGGGCFTGAVEVRSPDGLIRFDKLPPRSLILNETGTHEARLLIHEGYRGWMIELAPDKCVTLDHVMKAGGNWVAAEKKYPHVKRIWFEGTIFTLHVASMDVRDSHFILWNGDVAHNKISCFSPNTKLKTQRGDVRFDELRDGDLVLTARGTWRRIVGIRRRSYSGPALNMGGDELVTPEHLFQAESVWARVDELHPEFPVGHYEGEIWNVEVETEDGDNGSRPDTEHSYTLARGDVAHNVLT
jgi:Putative phage tail protein/Hint domain